MKLHRLRIEHIRQFRTPLDIADLTPGLNLFCGPNESGKSTLVRAIRAAFFERHRSSSVEDLQPWGDSSVAPQVTLEFDCQSRQCRLYKSFLKHKRCDLVVDGRHYGGEEAEELLAELLGFQLPGRGASRPEHWGIPGLLWIEQGDGQAIRAAVEHAGTHLQSALSHGLGEVASSAGDRVIEAVQRQRAELLTPTGRPTGEYARVLQRYDEQDATLRELDAQVEAYRQQVDRLADLSGQLSRDEAERPWEALRLKAREAGRQLAEVDDWIALQATQQQARQECLATLALLRDQLGDFQQRRDALARREEEQRRTQGELLRLKARYAPVEAALDVAREAYEQARETARQARQHERREALVRERGHLAEQDAGLQQRLARAGTLCSELQRLQARWPARPVAPEPLQALRQALDALERLTIQQQSIATRLHFALLDGQHLQLDGQWLSGEGECLVSRPVELVIDGVGCLRIQPGGEDLATLARRQERLRDEVARLLAELAVASLPEAERRWADQQELQGTIARLQNELALLAPHGVELLESERAAVQLRLRELDEQLAGLPATALSVLSVPLAEAAVEEAEQRLRSAEGVLNALHSEMAVATRNALLADDELALLRAELESPANLQREAQANVRLVDLRAEVARLEASLHALDERIAQARPDILRQDVERLEAAAAAQEQNLQRLRLERVALQARLEALGAEGLEERHAELTQALAFAARRRDELQRRANALDLLLTLLQEKRQTLTQRLQAPLQRHLDRYLQLLLPQARLEVDAQLIPARLRRQGAQGEADGAFEALSFGAREQVGLISRLAYADLLKEAGRPTLLILDDALVHSDYRRLDQMKRMLFDAARRHQILLFTCHPEVWRDLGVVARDLRALGSGQPA